MNLFHKCSNRPGSQSPCAGVCNQQQIVNLVTARGLGNRAPEARRNLEFDMVFGGDAKTWQAPAQVYVQQLNEIPWNCWKINFADLI